MSANRLRNLQVFREGDNTALRQNAPEFRTARTIVDRALLLLETGQGRRALVDPGRSIVRERRRFRQRCIYLVAELELTQMEASVGQFLRRMRRGFPPV